MQPNSIRSRESGLASAAAVAVLCKIALVPGAFGNDTSSLFLNQADYFKEYKAFFEAKGCLLENIDYPQDATIEMRALVLRDQLERRARSDGYGWTLVAHSQGGLDARFALKSLKMQGAKALVTIGTPHTGTPLADWGLNQKNSRGLSYWFLKIMGGYDLAGLPFLAEMTPEFLEKHKAKFAPVPGVRYAAARGVCRTDCARSVRVLSWWTQMPPGDGIVPGNNQAYGENLGEYDLDHISEVATDPEKAGERMRLLQMIWNWMGY